MGRRAVPAITPAAAILALLAAVSAPGRGDDPSPKLFGTPADERPAVPPKVAIKIIEAESKDIQDIFSAAKVMNKDRKRAFTAAAVIAGMADANSKDARFAGIRDQAGKLLDALTRQDLKAAKDHASALLSGQGGAGQTKFELHKYFWDPANGDYDRDLVMHLFKSQRAGGKGIEIAIKKWAAVAPNAKEMEEARVTAYEIATLADIIEKVAPGTGGRLPPANWIQLSKALKDAALEAAKMNKSDDMQKAMNKVDAACVTCHNQFKKPVLLPPPPKP